MRYLKKTCAVTLSTAMILSMAAGAGNIVYAADSIEKEETVYINLEADGTVTDITVSDWLKNVTGTNDISDVSNLTEIENVKGDETFTQSSDGKLVWKADKADIYYQGKTNEKPPVGVKVSYQLDGVDKTPSEVAGKSGKITITIQYENNSTYEDEINGVTTKMNTPFLMASAIILPVDDFSNVEISQGKMVSEGSNQILVAYGMPGLSESLDLSDDLKEELEKKLSDTVTITADVKDFSMGSIYTVATADVFADIELEDDSDINDLENAVNDLVDATDELISGSDELSEGLTTLQENFKTYAKGVKDVRTGASDLSKGANQLAAGVSQYTSGVTTLTNGTGQYVSGTQTLVKGINDYIAGEKLIDSGAKELNEKSAGFPASYSQFSNGLLGYVQGVNQIANVENAKQLATGSQQIADGITNINTTLGGLEGSLAAGEAALDDVLALIDPAELTAEQQEAITNLKTQIATQKAIVNGLKDNTSANSTLSIGAKTVAGAMSQLNAAAPSLVEGGETLKAYNTQISNGITGIASGIASLYNGIKTLSSNNETLLSGANTLSIKGSELTAGITKLDSSTKTLTDSASKLSKGAGTLSKGVNKLDTATKEVSDGVEKLQDGSVDLLDGMNRFKTEGTGKLQNEYDDNVKTVIDRFKSLTSGADEYKSFSGIADGMDGKVKFIFQTEEISSK